MAPDLQPDHMLSPTLTNVYLGGIDGDDSIKLIPKQLCKQLCGHPDSLIEHGPLNVSPPFTIAAMEVAEVKRYELRDCEKGFSLALPIKG